MNPTLKDAALVALLFALGACGGPRGDAEEFDFAAGDEAQSALLALGTADVIYLEDVATFAVGEQQASTLAAQRSSSALVRAYAQYIANYSAAQQQNAVQIGARQGVFIASDLSTRDIYHLERLKMLTGPAFDAKYLSYQAASLQRGTSDSQLQTTLSLDLEVQHLAAALSQELPRIHQLVLQVNSYRGTSQDSQATFDGWTTTSKAGDKTSEPQQGPESRPPPPAAPPQQGPGQK